MKWLKSLPYNSTFLKVITISALVVAMLFSVSQANAQEIRGWYKQMTPSEELVLDLKMTKPFSFDKTPGLVTAYCPTATVGGFGMVTITFPAVDGWSIVNNGGTAPINLVTLISSMPLVFNPGCDKITIKNNHVANLYVYIQAEY